MAGNRRRAAKRLPSPASGIEGCQTRVPASFFKLAAKQIRRELIDLYRHHYGAEGDGAHHASDPGHKADDGMPPLHDGADPATGVSTAFEQTQFHEKVQELPEEERDVFLLIFYEGMQQADVAKVVGMSERTVKRRWRDAQISLRKLLQVK